MRGRRGAGARALWRAAARAAPTRISPSLHQWRSAHATRSVRSRAAGGCEAGRTTFPRTSTPFKIFFMLNWVFEQSQAIKVWKCKNVNSIVTQKLLLITGFYLRYSFLFSSSKILLLYRNVQLHNCSWKCLLHILNNGSWILGISK